MSSLVNRFDRLLRRDHPFVAHPAQAASNEAMLARNSRRLMISPNDRLPLCRKTGSAHSPGGSHEQYSGYAR
jgi:hypothetical protein